jgi:uncharacterized membrane protein (DUF4010 family)
MVTSAAFLELGISLLLGFLVGLQREKTESGMPGMRTFPLITVLGTVCAMLADRYGGWVVAAGLLAVLVTLAFPSLARLRRSEPDPGITTDVAALLMYAVGALLVVAPLSLPVAIGGGVAVLLQFKPELHRFAVKLGDQDLRAIMQFVVITFIILPVLPDRTYGPLSVLNPFETWLMVVLIVGMSLGGYIAYKFMGRDAGILLGGVLGGAISSTATTVSYSRQARSNSVAVHTAAIVIMIASTIVFIRVLIEIAVVAPEFLPVATPPIAILMVLTMIPALAAWYRVRRQPAEMPEQKNPTQLTSAVFFALMYSAVLLALAVVKQYAGENALYGVAFLSGLTDMDAITLSTARMARADPLFAADAWRLLIVAALANLIFKTGIVALLGHRRLMLRVLLMFAIPIAGGALLLAFWHSP